MGAINVLLIAYQGGAPGDLADPPMKWSEVAEEAITSFEAPPSSLIVLHPGSEALFHRWMGWAAKRRGDVALLIVSSDPGAYEAFLREAGGRVGGNALDHVFVMPERLAMKSREGESAASRFLRSLAPFVAYVQALPSPINAADAPKLWSYFSAAMTAARRKRAGLAMEAMLLLLARRVGAAAARKSAERMERFFDGEAGALQAFLQLDSDVGAGAYPYSYRRHHLHHTTLTQRIVGVLRSPHATEAEKAEQLDTWKTVVRKECAELAEQALVALNPDPIVRAAMFVADPWSTPSREEQLERETWDADAMNAATAVISEAKASPPADVSERVKAFRAACAAVDAAKTPEAALPELLKVTEMLGGVMKVQHGAKAAD